MPLLIDGHNLIGQLPDLSLSDPRDEVKLVARLQAYAARSAKRITVVFDPGPGSASPPTLQRRSQHGHVEVIYADSGQKADDVIRSIVGATRDRQGLLVVTSDGALANFTRQCGVRVISAGQFAKALIDHAPRHSSDEKPTSSQDDVAAWLAVFKEPEAPPPAPSQPQPDPRELKRKRRMAQLNKQVRGGGRLY
jgi:predicted RNA-binding protein with PIN domain